LTGILLIGWMQGKIVNNSKKKFGYKKKKTPIPSKKTNMNPEMKKKMM
jgi:hypothetical protein